MSGSRRKSRYQYSKPFVNDGVSATFLGFRPRHIETPPGVLEHEVKAWDRLDLLAINYYSDAGKWWRILDANPQISFGADVHFRDGDESLVGTRILIPKDV